MISYVTLGTRDLQQAADFYASLLGDLGAKRLINMERIVFIGKSTKSRCWRFVCLLTKKTRIRVMA